MGTILEEPSPCQLWTSKAWGSQDSVRQYSPHNIRVSSRVIRQATATEAIPWYRCAWNATQRVCLWKCWPFWAPSPAYNQGSQRLSELSSLTCSVPCWQNMVTLLWSFTLMNGKRCILWASFQSYDYLDYSDALVSITLHVLQKSLQESCSTVHSLRRTVWRPQIVDSAAYSIREWWLCC